jgi:hypothetical protein
MVMDFVSMYPIIMAIVVLYHPSVILDNHGYARFSSVWFCYMYSKRSLDDSMLSCIVYGSNIRVPNAPESSIKICESIGVDAHHDMSYDSTLVLLTEKVRSQE